MPPNADQRNLRQRFIDKNFPPFTVDDAGQSHTISTQDRVDSVKNLKDTEVAIDGIIYDLKGFDHPGGNSFLVFGGNDVTVMYNMIHPNHTHHHLSKLKKVGKVLDWKQE